MLCWDSLKFSAFGFYLSLTVMQGNVFANMAFYTFFEIFGYLGAAYLISKEYNLQRSISVTFFLLTGCYLVLLLGQNQFIKLN